MPYDFYRFLSKSSENDNSQQFCGERIFKKNTKAKFDRNTEHFFPLFCIENSWKITLLCQRQKPSYMVDYLNQTRMLEVEQFNTHKI